MSYLRSAAAVLAGFLLMAALVILVSFGTDVLLGVRPGAPRTPLYHILNLLGELPAGVAGGYLCAKIAPRAPAQHALSLALLVLVVRLAALLSQALSFAQPMPGRLLWYPLVSAVLGSASIIGGGWLFLGRSHGWPGATSPVSSATPPAETDPARRAAKREETQARRLARLIEDSAAQRKLKELRRPDASRGKSH